MPAPVKISASLTDLPQLCELRELSAKQLMKIRTTDFRILFGVNLTAAIGTFLIFVKMLGWC